MNAPTIHPSPETLDEIDAMGKDLLVLGIFDDEKPLRGLNGLADWRMSGRLSRLLMKNTCSGALAERILLPSLGRLGAERILILGLGASDRFDNMIFVKTCESIMSVSSQIQATSLALAIPGSHKSRDYLLERLAILIKEIRLRGPGEVTLFLGRSKEFKENRAKFELIRDEVDKTLRPNPRRRG